MRGSEKLLSFSLSLFDTFLFAHSKSGKLDAFFEECEIRQRHKVWIDPERSRSRIAYITEHDRSGMEKLFFAKTHTTHM